MISGIWFGFLSYGLANPRYVDRDIRAIPQLPGVAEFVALLTEHIYATQVGPLPQHRLLLESFDNTQSDAWLEYCRTLNRRGR